MRCCQRLVSHGLSIVQVVWNGTEVVSHCLSGAAGFIRLTLWSIPVINTSRLSNPCYFFFLEIQFISVLNEKLDILVPPQALQLHCHPLNWTDANPINMVYAKVIENLNTKILGLTQQFFRCLQPPLTLGFYIWTVWVSLPYWPTLSDQQKPLYMSGS